MQNEELYYATRDYQTDGFGFYRALTIEEWREQALDWCDSDGNEELYETIKKLPKKYVLDYIQDIWTIKIEKVNKDEIVKYFIKNSDNYGNFSHYLRIIKKKIEENNIIFSKDKWENDLFFNEIDKIIEYFEKNNEILYEKENENE